MRATEVRELIADDARHGGDRGRRAGGNVADFYLPGIARHDAETRAFASPGESFCHREQRRATGFQICDEHIARICG
jgi:hypothetical protein